MKKECPFKDFLIINKPIIFTITLLRISQLSWLVQEIPLLMIQKLSAFTPGTKLEMINPTATTPVFTTSQIAHTISHHPSYYSLQVTLPLE